MKHYTDLTFEKFNSKRGVIFVINTTEHELSYDDLNVGDTFEFDGIKHEITSTERFVKNFGIKGDNVALLTKVIGEETPTSHLSDLNKFLINLANSDKIYFRRKVVILKQYVEKIINKKL